MKRVLLSFSSIIILALIIISLYCVLEASSYSYANTIVLERYDITMDQDHYYGYGDYYTYKDSVGYYVHYYDRVKVLSGKVADIKSSNDNIVWAEYDETWDEIYLYANCELGSCSVTVTDETGDTTVLNVTVSFPFILSESHLNVDCSYNYYYSYYSDDMFVPGYRVTGNHPLDDDEYSYMAEVQSDNPIRDVRSLDKTIVELDDMNHIIPVGVGTAVVECTDIFGQKATFTVTVNEQFVSGLVKQSTRFQKLIVRNCVEGETLPKAKVTVIVSKKKYTGKADKDGYFKIPIPHVKNGAKLKVMVNANGGSYSAAKAFQQPNYEIIDTLSYAYRDSKKIKVEITDAEKGDVLTVKIGKKTYKKKIPKNDDDYICTIKIKKPKKAGTKIKYILKDKHKHLVATGKSKVYYAKRVKKGMTKKQCKLVPGWEKPSSNSYINGKTIWWYKDNAWLMFKNGKLVGWHY